MTKRKFTIGALCGLASLLTASLAHAQDVRITYPAPDEDVRGEIIVRWEGIPEGGYAMVFVDGQLRQGTAEDQLTLNTLPPFFPDDGQHTITIRAINSAGRRAGEASVTFNIANKKVNPDAESVQLFIWKAADRLGPVQRYRIFAESNANIDNGSTAGGGGGGGGAASGGAGGDAGGGAEFLPAPLDWQVTALLRRVLRDVGMVDGSANIRTVVDTAFQRMRQSEYGGGGAQTEGGAGGSSGAAPKKSSAKKGPGIPIKAPWHYDETHPLKVPLWEVAPETGQYFVKMVHQTGEEINATRKPTTIALADLLPTFPAGPVKPGNTWETTMTFLSDLSNRKPINVAWRMLFSKFEEIKTPAGVDVRAAKLESRFAMPDKQAKEIALSLAANAGTGAGGAGAGAASGAEGGGTGGAAGAGAASAGGGAATAEIDPDSVKNYRTNVSRVLWFDIANRRVVKCEDTLNTYFEMEGAAAGGGGEGGAAQGGQGADAAEAEPTKVTYRLYIVTQLDDTIPEVTPHYDKQRIIPTGHVDPLRNPDNVSRPNNRDRTLVRDPSIDKALIP